MFSFVNSPSFFADLYFFEGADIVFKVRNDRIVSLSHTHTPYHLPGGTDFDEISRRETPRMHINGVHMQLSKDSSSGECADKHVSHFERSTADRPGQQAAEF